MTYKTILFETTDKTGIIRLNRPERMNAVNEQMYLEIEDVLSRSNNDNNIRSLILTGSILNKNGIEKQAFCAGADLKKHSEDKRTHAQKRNYIQLAHNTTKLIHEFPKPVIAAINGPARGAGAEMAISCDFIIIADKATIAFPEVGLGTFVGGGVTSHLPEIAGIMKARELIYTGKVIDAAESVNLGIALKFCPAETLMNCCLEFAEKLNEKAPVSLGYAKSLLGKSPALDLDTVLNLETDAILSCMDTEDWHEGIKAFNEKRKPHYKGC